MEILYIPLVLRVATWSSAEIAERQGQRAPAGEPAARILVATPIALRRVLPA